MFNGSNESARSWMEEYESSCELNSWSEKEMVKYFPAYLEGSPLSWYKYYVKVPAADNRIAITWAFIKERFNKNYFSVMNRSKLGKQIDSRSQRHNEAVNAFIADMRALLQMYDPSMSETMQVDKIRERLLPVFQKFVAVSDPTTYEELVDLCVKVEVGEEACSRKHGSVGLVVDRENIKKDKKSPRERRNQFSRNKNTTPKTSIDTSKLCSRCERQMHLKNECFAKTKADRTELSDTPPCTAPPRRSKVVPKDTPSPVKKTSSEITKMKRVATIVNTIEPEKNSYIEVPTKINGIFISSMADTSALLTAAMSEETARANKFAVEPYPDEMKPKEANGLRLHMIGITTQETEIRLGNITKILQVEYHVIRHLPVAVLIGKRTLKRLRICIRCDTDRDTLSYIDDEEDEDDTSDGNQAPIAEAVCPVMKTDNVSTKRSGTVIASQRHKVAQRGEWDIQTVKRNQQNTGYECNKCPNLHAIVARFEPLEENEIFGSAPVVNAILNVDDTGSSIEIGDELDTQQIREVKDLIVTYKDIFSFYDELGSTNVCEHDIELLPGSKPTAEPLRRHAQIEKEAVKKQIEDMLA